MFNKKLAIVDLSKNKVNIGQTSDSLKKLFLGGESLPSINILKVEEIGQDENSCT